MSPLSQKWVYVPMGTGRRGEKGREDREPQAQAETQGSREPGHGNTLSLSKLELPIYSVSHS